MGHVELITYASVHLLQFFCPSLPPSLPLSALHVAIINNHTDVVRALLDVLPQLPPTQTPVVDTQNHLHQVCRACERGQWVGLLGGASGLGYWARPVGWDTEWG